MSHAAPTPLDRAIKVWQGIFTGGPYTALKMLEYIMDTGNKTPEDFLRSPKKALEGITDDYISKQNIDIMATAWRDATGRCTSFAVNAKYTLSQEKDGDDFIYDFCLYDLGGHRIARCRKTGIVIDSSSTVTGGAFVLAEGVWSKFDETSASWKYSSNESKFERNGNASSGNVQKSSIPITPAQAMEVCFREVEAIAPSSIPTLFRTVTSDGKAHFYGMVSWKFQARAIDMVPDTLFKDRKLVIQWAQQKRDIKGQPTKDLDESMVGSKEDFDECLLQLAKFIAAYGGPGENGPTQWKADKIDEFSGKMAAMAVKLWGYPKFIDRMPK